MISSCLVSQLHMLSTKHPGFDSRRPHTPRAWWLNPLTLLLGDKDIGMELVTVVTQVH